MMKYKAKSLKSTILIVIIIVALIVVANFFGIGTMRSATRVGYVGNDRWRSWSASYTMLDGKLKHTIRPEDTQKTLHVKIVTEGGGISIEMKDAGGNVIFDEDNIETSNFDVNVSGKVVVSIEADKHKGSFDIEATG
jgi:hypothetical protein